VENVDWEDAVEFCKKLSELPAEKKEVRTYRLPTEAEWEYACRGRAPSYQVFHFGNSLSSRQANFGGRVPWGAEQGPSLSRSCIVGSYAPNGFGLYDMHGNVWEWCSDWYGADYYSHSQRRDPPGPGSGSSRVFRGGCWRCGARGCRSAVRGRVVPEFRLWDVGFRVAVVPPGR
jgi:formylglycine-generating enzyme required for sulfatase activity